MCLRSFCVISTFQNGCTKKKVLQLNTKKGQRNIQSCVTNWWTQRLSKNFIDFFLCMWFSLCVCLCALCIDVGNRLCCCWTRVLVILIALLCSKQCTFQFKSIVPLVFFLRSIFRLVTVTLRPISIENKKNSSNSITTSTSILCTRESYNEIEVNYVNREKGNRSNCTDN